MILLLNSQYNRRRREPRQWWVPTIFSYKWKKSQWTISASIQDILSATHPWITQHRRNISTLLQSQEHLTISHIPKSGSQPRWFYRNPRELPGTTPRFPCSSECSKRFRSYNAQYLCARPPTHCALRTATLSYQFRLHWEHISVIIRLQVVASTAYCDSKLQYVSANLPRTP